MNRRIALKVGSRAEYHSIGRVQKAVQVLWHMRRGCCHDCPEGLDDESGGLCPNRKGCNAFDRCQLVLEADLTSKVDVDAALANMEF